MVRGYAEKRLILTLQEAKMIHFDYYEEYLTRISKKYYYVYSRSVDVSRLMKNHHM